MQCGGSGGTETTATALDRGRWHGPVTVKRPDGRVDIDRHAKGRKGDHCVYGAMEGAGTAGDYPSVTHPAAPPARKWKSGVTRRQGASKF